MNEFSIDTKIYKPVDCDSLIVDIPFVKSNKKVEFSNIPISFDIETSSFMENDFKRAIMYAWTLCVNGHSIIGRTYESFIMCLHKISKKYECNKNKRIIVYVHNLSYEFQFIRGWFKWEKVFAIEERKIAYALTTNGIEFRCSYLLSGYSLESVAKNLTKYKIKKLVGDLDYSLIRHMSTPLNNKEIGYIQNDGQIVCCYIREELDSYGNNISRIPLTKTGKVRTYVRNKCYYTKGSHKVTASNNQRKYYKYRQLMNVLQIDGAEEYLQLKRAFSGGFTHANGVYVGSIIKDVHSFDFTSSYPAVMCSEYFPMSKGKIIQINTKEEFEKYLSKYCCIFDIKFHHIKSSVHFEHPISLSKCFQKENVKTNNGRVVSADSISITITEVDYDVIKNFYKWKKIEVTNFRIYRRGYLPRDLILSILELYMKKTTLKGVKGFEKEYLISKENVNSVYGMMVTDICRDEIEYDEDDVDNGGWITTECDYEKEISKYNRNIRRFLFYPWGIYVTAHARSRLFSGIYQCGWDYVYSDTDSIKLVNLEKHLDYFKRYNDNMILKMKKISFLYKIPFSYFAPKTQDGEEKILGLWDYEGKYELFKTWGAKRYMIKNKNGYSLTISGLNKETAIPYLYNKYGDKIFDAFKEGMYIPPEYTGKKIHTYLDFEQKGVVKDYFGKYRKYHEKSSIHLSGCEYDMSIAKEFAEFLMGVKTYEKNIMG